MISRETLNALAKAGRIEIIRTLRAYPDRDFSMNELARTSGTPTMTAWRAIRDLRKLGYVKTRRIGNAIVVSLTRDHQTLRALRIVPETDPQRSAAILFSSRIGVAGWVEECRLFGNIGRGEHSPGDEVDVAVVYDEETLQLDGAKEEAQGVAAQILAETNVTIVPFCLSKKDMARKSGLAAELRDKEVIWSRRPTKDEQRA